jgi:hypothetical protein
LAQLFADVIGNRHAKKLGAPETGGKQVTADDGRSASASFTILHSSFVIPFVLTCQHESDSPHGR